MKKIFAILLSVFFVAGCSNSVNSDAAKIALLNENKKSSAESLGGVYINVIPKTFYEDSRIILPVENEEKFIEYVKKVESWNFRFAPHSGGSKLNVTLSSSEDGKFHINTVEYGTYDLTVTGEYISEDKSEKYYFYGYLGELEISSDLEKSYDVYINFETDYYSNGDFSAVIDGFSDSSWPVVTKNQVEALKADGKEIADIFNFVLLRNHSDDDKEYPDSIEPIYSADGQLTGINVTYSDLRAGYYWMELIYNQNFVDKKSEKKNVLFNTGNLVLISKNTETKANCTAIYSDISEDIPTYYATCKTGISGNGLTPATRTQLWDLIRTIFANEKNGIIYCDDFIFDVQEYNDICRALSSTKESVVVIKYSNESSCEIAKSEIDDYTLTVTNSFTVKGKSGSGANELTIDEYMSTSNVAGYKFKYEGDQVKIKLKKVDGFFGQKSEKKFEFLLENPDYYLGSDNCFFEYIYDDVSQIFDNDKFIGLIDEGKVVVHVYDEQSGMYLNNPNYKISYNTDENGNHLCVALSGEMLFEDGNQKYYISVAPNDKSHVFAEDDGVVKLKEGDHLYFYVHEEKSKYSKLDVSTHTLIGWEINGMYLPAESSIPALVVINKYEREGFYIDTARFVKYFNYDDKNVIRCIIKNGEIYSSAQMYFQFGSDEIWEENGTVLYTNSSNRLKSLYKGDGGDIIYTAYDKPVYNCWNLPVEGVTILEVDSDDGSYHDIKAVRKFTDGFVQELNFASISNASNVVKPKKINNVAYDIILSLLWISFEDENGVFRMMRINNPLNISTYSEYATDYSVDASLFAENSLNKLLSTEKNTVFDVYDNYLYVYSFDAAANKGKIKKYKISVNTSRFGVPPSTTDPFTVTEEECSLVVPSFVGSGYKCSDMRFVVKEYDYETGNSVVVLYMLFRNSSIALNEYTAADFSSSGYVCRFDISSDSVNEYSADFYGPSKILSATINDLLFFDSGIMNTGVKKFKKIRNFININYDGAVQTATTYKEDISNIASDVVINIASDSGWTEE